MIAQSREASGAREVSSELFGVQYASAASWILLIPWFFFVLSHWKRWFCCAWHLHVARLLRYLVMVNGILVLIFISFVKTLDTFAILYFSHYFRDITLKNSVDQSKMQNYFSFDFFVLECVRADSFFSYVNNWEEVQWNTEFEWTNWNAEKKWMANFHRQINELVPSKYVRSLINTLLFSNQ